MLDNLGIYADDVKYNGIKSDGSKIKVLIVDDSMAVRRLLHRVFDTTKYEVVAEADNGKKAIDKFNELHPDIVTMDIVMPEMEGVDAINVIFDKNPGAKIVMLTSLAQQNIAEECIEKGAKSYIVKPIIEKNIPSMLSDIKNIAIN